MEKRAFSKNCNKPTDWRLLEKMKLPKPCNGIVINYLIKTKLFLCMNIRKYNTIVFWYNKTSFLKKRRNWLWSSKPLLCVTLRDNDHTWLMAFAVQLTLLHLLRILLFYSQTKSFTFVCLFCRFRFSSWILLFLYLNFIEQNILASLNNLYELKHNTKRRKYNHQFKFWLGCKLFPMDLRCM